jgi:hypothetical protein
MSITESITDKRSHSSLGYQTPAEYARSASDAGLQSAYGLLPSSIAKKTNPQGLLGEDDALFLHSKPIKIMQHRKA